MNPDREEQFKALDAAIDLAETPIHCHDERCSHCAHQRKVVAAARYALAQLVVELRPL